MRRAALGLVGAASLLCCALLTASVLLQPCAAGRLASLPSAGATSGRGSEGLHGGKTLRDRLLHGVIEHGDSEAETPAPAPSPDGGGQQSSALTASKVGAIFVFLAVPLVGCFLPWVLPIPPWLLNYAVLFSAGLFFALALEHLLGDSAGGFATLTTSSYPFPYMIFVSGYFLTWLADITARAVWERQEGVRRQRRLAEAAAGAAAAPAMADPAAAPLAAPGSGRVACCKSGRAEDVEASSGEKGEALAEGALGAGAGGAGRCPGKECGCDGGSCRCTAPSYMEFDTPDAIGRAAEASSVYDLNFLEVLLLMLALCFHAVFEGLAVGLSTSVGDVWGTTSIVVIHKFLEGIALGTTLLAQNSSRSFFGFLLYALGFSCMAPLGIAIGIILGSTTTSIASDWIEAIGNGLAAGVFVFVAVGHLMVKAMKPLKGDRWWAPFPKWGFAALGVLTMSLLMIRSV